MGAWRIVGKAAAAAALLCAARASGGVVVEPIARLSLEGGYDSNPLFDGRTAAAQSARVMPDVGLRLRSPLWDVRGTYGGELVYFTGGLSDQLWNHRASFAVDARPTRRTTLAGTLHVIQAIDPAGLARVGVFRAGGDRAFVIGGRARLEWRAGRRLDAAATFFEQTVLFEDGTGGSLHAPGAELLWRYDRRLALGAAYAAGVFRSFAPSPRADDTALSYGLRARARWQATRHLWVNGWAGPALWDPGRGGSSVVPEALVELLVATRGLDLRVTASHALGIGATAFPGLVDAFELGGERRFGRRWFARGDAGMWRSGAVPDQEGAVTGYAIGGEAGVRFENDLRLSVTAARYGRVDEPAAAFDRTTAGVRLGWELPYRR
jgi:hypothetical protein